MNYTLSKGKIVINDTTDFDAKDIFTCGQVFRYKKIENDYMIYTLCHKARVYSHESTIIIECDDEKYFENYFDLCTDYGTIKQILRSDASIGKSISYGEGIRLLRQNPLETIISFIISANNNIPRIRTIIERICTDYGQDMGDYFAFPTLDALLSIPEEYFKDIKCGYRSSYLYKTIRLLKDVDLDALYSLPTELLRKELLKLYGVGRKVADCILLFGYQKMDVFPTDTWIKKVFLEQYGISASAEKISDILTKKYGNYSGYAQQYLFYGKRENFGGK